MVGKLVPLETNGETKPSCAGLFKPTAKSAFHLLVSICAVAEETLNTNNSI